MRLIQHKREAYWFYRFLSLGYDRWVNPLFWTPAMRELALEKADLAPGQTVLDTGAGTGFTTEGIVARVDAASVTMLDQSPHQLARSRTKPALANCPRVLGDAENLPFGDDEFDKVISSIGVMFAPHHQAAADELVRTCRPGGTIALLSWTPDGMLGDLFRTMGPFAPPPPPGAQAPPLWGSEEHLAELFGDRVTFATQQPGILEITAFARPEDYAEHFKARYGPTIVAQANARKDGREAEFEAALQRFCEDHDRGTPDHARFEMQYLVSVGTKA